MNETNSYYAVQANLMLDKYGAYTVEWYDLAAFSTLEHAFAWLSDKPQIHYDGMHDHYSQELPAANARIVHIVKTTTVVE